jgi:hypothetical protein
LGVRGGEVEVRIGLGAKRPARELNTAQYHRRSFNARAALAGALPGQSKWECPRYQLWSNENEKKKRKKKERGKGRSLPTVSDSP